MLRSSPFASSLSVHEGKQVISLDDELLAMMKLETPQMWMEQKQTKPPNKKAKIPTEPYKTDARLQPQKVSETLYEEWSAYKLNENILSSLEARGFNSPTQIQKLVLMESSKCQDGTLPDVIASAPTGSGKTLAFLLPLIHAILAYSQNVATKETSLNNNIHPPVSNVEASDEIVMTDSPMDVIPPILALILVPTRELAFQINHSALDLVRELGIRVFIWLGLCSFLGCLANRWSFHSKTTPRLIEKGGYPHFNTRSSLEYHSGRRTHLSWAQGTYFNTFLSHHR